MTVAAVDQARADFPRGLSQPDTGFRFSMDALLLAGFAGRAGQGRVVDLGTGCGVVGLALALNHPDFFVTGLDLDPAMLGHARINAARLGLAGRFGLVRSDVRRPGGLLPESMDLVVANPPYRDMGTGRVCPDKHKTTARFEDQAGLIDFARAAAFFLGNRKSCCLIHLAERVDHVLAALSSCRLRPKEILFIHPLADRPARLVLVRAVKNGGVGLTVRPPLVVHEERGSQTVLTRQILDFCPCLACNDVASSKSAP